MVSSSRNRYSMQCGSVLFFVAAVIIPLFFALAAISLDVSRVSVKRSSLQEALDNAALYGVRFLPDKQNVIRGVTSYWERLGIPNNLAVDVIDDKVVVKSEDKFVPIFGAIFNEVGIEFNISIPSQSAARVVPHDVALVLDRGRNTAPSIFSPSSAGWGDEGNWGPAKLFTDEVRILKDGHIIDPRIATQQCFNPKFVSIKASLVNALIHLGGFNLNKVLILSSPGAVSELGIIRELSFSGNHTPSLIDSHIDWDGDHYTTVYEEEDHFPVKSVHCAAIASEENTFQNYRFPQLVDDDQSEIVDHATWKIVDTFLLKYQHVIWSKAARSDRVMDFRAVVSSLKQTLLLTVPEENRGGLVRHTRKLALIFTSTVPYLDGIRFDNASSAQITVLTNEILSYARECAHQRINCSLLFLTLEENAILVNELQSYFNDAINLEANLHRHLIIRIISSSDISELSDKITSTLLIGGQYAVLAT